MSTDGRLQKAHTIIDCVYKSLWLLFVIVLCIFITFRHNIAAFFDQYAGFTHLCPVVVSEEVCDYPEVLQTKDNLGDSCVQMIIASQSDKPQVLKLRMDDYQCGWSIETKDGTVRTLSNRVVIPANGVVEFRLLRPAEHACDSTSVLPYVKVVHEGEFLHFISVE